MTLKLRWEPGIESNPIFRRIRQSQAIRLDFLQDGRCENVSPTNLIATKSKIVFFLSFLV